MTKRTLGFALAGLAMFGCTTNDKNASLIITSVTIAAASNTTLPDGTVVSTCAFTVSTPEIEFPVFAPNGVGSSGSAGFVVKNQLRNPTTINSVLDADSTTFSPHQAVVDYEIVGGTQTIAEQIIPVSGLSVASGQSGAVVVPLFLPTAAFNVVKALPSGGIIRTTVRIEGKLDDGSTVTTSEHEYVVAVNNTATVGTNTPCF